MGWYNAGTDEKTSAPEIFGCVELPVPSQCFGATECNYGPKQREALISQLKDDKQQTMPWPTVLRQSFSDEQLLLDSSGCGSGSSRLGCRSPLYGSPMLDGALGKVGAVSQVLSLLLEEPTQGPILSARMMIQLTLTVYVSSAAPFIHSFIIRCPLS